MSGSPAESSPARTAAGVASTLSDAAAPSAAPSSSAPDSSIGRLSGVVLNRLSRRRSASEEPEDSLATYDAPVAAEYAQSVELALKDTVISVTFSADDRMIAAGGMDMKAHVLSSKTGDPIATFELKQAVTALAFCIAPGGIDCLVVATMVGTVHLFNLETKAQEWSTDQKATGIQQVLSLASGRDGGTRVVAAGKDAVHFIAYDVTADEGGKVGLHEAEFVPLCSHTARTQINSICISATGDLVAAGGEAKIVELWSKGVGDAGLGHFNSEAAFSCITVIHSLSLNAGGDLLAVGTSAEYTEVFRVIYEDASQQRSRHSSASRKGSAAARRGSGSGAAAAAARRGSGSGGGNTKVGTKEVKVTFDAGVEAKAKEGEARHQPKAPHQLPMLLSVRRSIAQAGTMSGENFTIEPLILIHGASAHNGGVSFSGTGSRLLIAGNQQVNLVDTYSGGVLRQIKRGGRVRCVAITRDGECFAAGGFDKRLGIISASGGARRSYYSEANFTAVRSVFRSSSSTLLALGGDAVGGTGQVALFDSALNSTLHSWKEAKAVWCVRICPEDELLVSAGYGFCMTVYSIAGKTAVQTLAYTSKIGPAFIWSLNFSDRESGKLVVGVWSGHTYVYEVDRSSADEPLKQVSDIKRDGRVYSVAITADARHVVVGGRDKMVACYTIGKTREEEQREAEEAEEALSELHHDERHDDDLGASAADAEGLSSEEAAKLSKFAKLFGGGGKGNAEGLAKKMLERSRARAGHRARIAWEVATGDFVYSVTLSNDMRYVAYGGTAKQLVVLDGASGAPLLQHTMSGPIWHLALLSTGSSRAIAAGGEFGTLSVFDLNSASAAGAGGGGKIDANLVESLHLPCSKTIHSVCITPTSIVYGAGDEAAMYGGADATAFRWADPPSFADASRMLVDTSAEEVQLVRCMGLMFDKHPTLINQTDAESGTSLLQYAVAHCGDPLVIALLLSSACKPALRTDRKGLSAMHVAVKKGLRRDVQMLLTGIYAPTFSQAPGALSVLTSCFPQVAAKYPADFLAAISQLKLQPEPELLGSTETTDIKLPGKIVRGSSRRCPHGLWDAILEQYRLGDRAAPQTSEPSDDSLGDDSTLNVKWSRPGLGYRADALRDGLQAMRVSLPNFAGQGEAVHGKVRYSPLRLIINASATTKSYDAFENVAVDALMNFKWNAFAKVRFQLALFRYVLHNFLVTAFAFVTAVFTIKSKVKPPLLISDPALTSSILRSVALSIGGAAIHSPPPPPPSMPLSDLQAASIATTDWWTEERFQYLIWLMLILWGALFALNLVGLVNEGREMYSAMNQRHKYWTVWNVYDWVHIIAQLSCTVMFWLGESMSAEEDSPVSVYTTMQVLSLLAVWFKGLYYFRGSISLSAFVHCLGAIASDLVPIFSTSFFLLSAFTLSMILMQLHADHDLSRALGSSFTTFNTALRLPPLFAWQPWKSIDQGDIDDGRLETAWQVVVFFQIFVMFGQLVLLNMLIAIVMQANARVRGNAKKVALFSRAVLIHTTEASLSSPDMRKWSHRLAYSIGERLPSWLWVNYDEATAYPAWLHVLQPPPVVTAKGNAMGAEANELKELRAQLGRSAPKQPTTVHGEKM